MSGLPWFRLYAELAGDPVIQSLAFEDQRHYVILLCLKCSGVLDRRMPCDRRESIIARGLGLDPLTAFEVKRRLMDVTLCDGNWQPTAWNKRQYKSDNSTERTRKYRKNKDTGNVSGTSQKRHCDGPDTDTDTEKRREEPPTVPQRGRKSSSKTISPEQQAKFDVFWEIYPRRTDKQAAVAAFCKLNPDQPLLETILCAVKRQSASENWVRDGGQFIPHPSTWLNKKRWEDEIPLDKPQSNGHVGLVSMRGLI